MKKLFYILTFIFISAISSETLSQIPAITIKNDSNNCVILNSLTINVEVVGNIATTTMKMVFLNSSNRILEGELTFPLPEGATVSGYALDINNKMRQAVPVPKQKATEVFESIEMRRVDPGLLEKVSGNNFRTRIYPIPANGTRTIEVSYQELLNITSARNYRYTLPLKYEFPINEFDLSIIVFDSYVKPELVESPDNNFTLTKFNRAYQGEIKRKNYKPTKSLTIHLPKNNDLAEAVVQENTDGSCYFLVNSFPKNKKQRNSFNGKLGIIWDCSLSAESKDIEKELELLNSFFNAYPNMEVEVGLLNTQFKNGKTFKIVDGKWANLKQYLTEITYDGATDYSKINQKTLQANNYLFFTDGLCNYGPSQVHLSKPIYAINTNLQADYSLLQFIATTSGGKSIDLAKLTVTEAIEQLTHSSLRFMGVKERGVSQVYPAPNEEINGQLTVVGIAGKGVENITLQYGRNGVVTETEEVNLKRTNLENQSRRLNTNTVEPDIYKVWAQKKIAYLDRDYNANKEEIEQLAMQFGLVTRNTSLMVLENVSDYVLYDITPPAELMEAYNKLKKNNRIQEQKLREDYLTAALNITKELKKWWNTDFHAKAPFPIPKKNTNTDTISLSEDIEFENEMIQHVANEEDAIVAAYASSPQVSYMLANEAAGIQVRSNSQDKTKKSTSNGSIVIAKIRADKDYLKKINAATDPYAEYLIQRKEYSNTPAFYFDVTNLLMDSGRAEQAFLVLSNIAELKLDNADLLRSLTYKLKELGNYEQELFIANRVKEMRPMDPQSHRDYALALADNKQYQAALDQLYSLLTRTYTIETNMKSGGIEEVLVCEINRLIALQNKLKTDSINQELIFPMPVDIRVVISWNQNHTDIDLWVTDPRGEKCYYGNKSTQIGGRISKDITQGYGPEQFMLKKAIKGKYIIETNFFGETQLKTSGPTTIMAEIYLYYSDGREERQIITLQDAKSNRGKSGVYIGEFNF